MILDLADLQWWQVLVAIVTGLGLSPAPWLYALASGKIQFTGPATAIFEKRLEDQKNYYENRLQSQEEFYSAIRELDARRYAEMEQSRDYYRQSRLEEKDRADLATERLAESVEVGKAALQMLRAVDEAAGKGP